MFNLLPKQQILFAMNFFIFIFSYFFRKCELREAFKAIDRDGKGKLDRGDIMAQLQCLGETRTDEEMNILMSKADVDGDGMIDFNEFLESWGSYCN